MRLYSNEIVFRGHPDKVCDQISDALLDAYLKQDENARCGIEVMGGKGKIPGVVVGGLIIGLINYGMTALTIPSSYQKIVMGALIIISVAIDHLVATKK